MHEYLFMHILKFKNYMKRKIRTTQNKAARVMHECKAGE
jgi:hypothetical protein